MNTLAFDIETVPDTDTGRRLHDMQGISDADVARAMQAKQMQKSGADFLPLHLHRIVAISAVLRADDKRGGKKISVWSLGEEDSPEEVLVGKFYDGVARLKPTLVSWNGGGFDLPVLHYRALLHGIAAAQYWEEGGDFRFDNYRNRFHWRHTDLMDVLSGFQMRAVAGLDEVAVMLGFPGKLGGRGDAVWDMFQAGKIGAIRDYCESDALNTHLVYLRFELMRGRLDAAGYEAECELVRGKLRASGKAHLREFLEVWEG